MGFYEKAEQRVPLKAVRVAADVPAAERSALCGVGPDAEYRSVPLSCDPPRSWVALPLWTIPA